LKGMFLKGFDEAGDAGHLAAGQPAQAPGA
jgi:hypothetical protein